MPYNLIYNYMDINLTFETSTTSVGLVSIDPGFVEKYIYIYFSVYIYIHAFRFYVIRYVFLCACCGVRNKCLGWPKLVETCVHG